MWILLLVFITVLLFLLYVLFSKTRPVTFICTGLIIGTFRSSKRYYIPFCMENTHFSHTKKCACFDRVLGTFFWYSNKYLLSNAHYLANDYKCTKISGLETDVFYCKQMVKSGQDFFYFAIPLAPFRVGAA